MTDRLINTILHGAPRAELARLCRHICLAREQGTMSPITAEEEFMLALTTVRATYGPESAGQDDLREIVGIEESRVADASAIAELVAARIATLSPFPSASPESTSLPSASKAREKQFGSAEKPVPIHTGHPLSVADLIDGMLSQERRDVRSPARL